MDVCNKGTSYCISVSARESQWIAPAHIAARIAIQKKNKQENFSEFQLLPLSHWSSGIGAEDIGGIYYTHRLIGWNFLYIGLKFCMKCESRNHVHVREKVAGV